MQVMQMDVLDHGYVRLVDHMGSDLSVANAARVSFAKESEFKWSCIDCPEHDVNTVSEYFNGERESDEPYYCGVCGGYCASFLSLPDEKLIRFLAAHDHTSPFRHAFFTFEVKAPLFVCRQWWKYVVGSDHTMEGWNEVSRRYVQDGMEFYVPQGNAWRSAPENKKQGSGEPVSSHIGDALTIMLKFQIQKDLDNYSIAIEQGVAIEEARLFLPAYGMYTMWRWSGSLQAAIHFLKQRLDDGAQYEIQQYAKAVKELLEPHFPVSLAAFGL